MVSPDGMHLTILPEYHSRVLEIHPAYQLVDRRTGEVLLTKNGSQKYFLSVPGMKIDYLIPPKGVPRMYVRLSLPKFHFNTNARNFSLEEYQEAIYGLCARLNVPIDAISLHSLEIGFVSKLRDVKASEAINSIMLYRKKVLTYEVQKGVVKRNVLIGDKELKMYDKGVQCGLDYELIRMELIFKNRRAIESNLGVKQFSDLLLAKTSIRMVEAISKALSNLLFFDKRLFDLEQMIPNQTQVLYQMSSPYYWPMLNNWDWRKSKRLLLDLNRLISNNLMDEVTRPLNNLKQNHLNYIRS